MECPDRNSRSILKRLSPVPAEMRLGRGFFQIQPEMFLEMHAGRGIGAAWKELLPAFREKMPGLRIRRGGGRSFQLNLSADADFRPHGLPDASGEREGYFLRISAQGVSLTASAAAGFYYGIRTFLRLLELSPRMLPCVTIHDAPDLEWRGYAPFFGGHCSNSDPGNPARYRQIAAEMAGAGLNRIALESEAFAEDAELEKFGRFCRTHFIEVVPFHPFLCINHRNVAALVKASDAEFAEMMRPAERAIRILKPRFFGIAGDELIQSYDHVRRESVYSPEERAERPPHEWFALCLMRLRSYLKKHRVRMVMWADGLLDPDRFRGHGCEMKDFNGGAPDFHARALDRIPRDILLWDWQYSPAREYASADYLLDAGFQVVGGAILSGASERLFPEYCFRKKNRNFLGMMSLTWAGKNPDERLKPGHLEHCGGVYWNVGRYASESPAADSFRRFMREENPFGKIGGGRRITAVSGPGERFACCSSGRIYCSLREDGIGAWHPSMHLFSDLWFTFTAAERLRFRSAGLILTLNGKGRAELFLGDAPQTSLRDFRKFGEIARGADSAEFDLSTLVSGKHSFCVWLRISENEDYPFLRELKLVSRTVRAAERV